MWVDNSLPASILELFADAQRPARYAEGTSRVFRAGGPRTVSPQCLAASAAARRLLPRVAAVTDRFTVLMPAYTKQRVVVRLHVPALPVERVAGCSCGGWLERRVGLGRLVHVGKAGCVNKRGGRAV